MAVERKNMKNRDKLEMIEVEDNYEIVCIHEVREYLLNLVISLQRTAGEMDPNYLTKGGTLYNPLSKGIAFTIGEINKLFGTSFEDDQRALVHHFGRELKKTE